jgi:transposase
MSELEQEWEATRRGARRRRIWTAEEKRQILAETLAPGASISVVARRHDVNANLLFTWRRQLRAMGSPASDETAGFVPARIAPPPAVSSPVAETAPEDVAAGRMEIVLAGGDRVIVGADVNPAALARVIKALSRR